MKYRADIDGLRAIAVLLVLVFHFDLFGLGQAGFIGVDVFFVISGYLISGIIWRDLEAGKFSLGHFYARRVRRLAPALIAVQFLVLGTAALVLLPNEVRDLAKESLATQLYVSNIYYWLTLNYFGVHADGAYMLHTWSLGVEEQFYLLYPLFLLLVHRWAKKWLCAVLIATFLISFALNIGFVATKPEAAFYLLPTRAWELVAGALLVFVQPWFERSGPARAIAGPAGLAAIVLALAIHGPGTPFPGWFALLPVLAACLLLMAGSGDSSLTSRLLSAPVATFFGRISYPLYLIHWPLNVLGVVALPAYSLPVRWGFFLLSIVIAWLITLLVEAPVRRGKWLATDRRMVHVYIGCLAGVLVVIASAWTTGGWRFRFSDQVLRVADTAGDVDTESKRWDFVDRASLDRSLRPIGKQASAPVWFIYGDSHAAALAGAFSLWLEGRGEAGELAYHSGCLPLLDTGSASCRSFNRQAIAHAAGRNILLVSIWRQPLEPGYRGRQGQVLVGDAAKADFTDAVTRTVTALRQAGARVYAWEPLPSAHHFVPEAMARSMTFGPYWPVQGSLQRHRAEMDFVASALDRAGIPKQDRVDPAPAVCPGGTCPFTLNGMPLYSDNNHPAKSTTPWFAKLMNGALH